EQRPYNPLMAILLQTFHFFNRTTIVIVFSTFAAFSITIDYLTCFRAGDFIYELGHQLMVMNGQQLLTLNSRRLGGRPSWTSFRKAHRWLLQWARLLRTIWQSNDLRFQCPRLDDFPYISRRLRARLA